MIFVDRLAQLDPYCDGSEREEGEGGGGLPTGAGCPPPGGVFEGEGPM